MHDDDDFFYGIEGKQAYLSPHTSILIRSTLSAFARWGGGREEGLGYGPPLSSLTR